MCGLPERKRTYRQLRQSLLSKGISREILDLCFEEETVDEEGRGCPAFFEEKGYTDGAGEDPEKTRKLAAALGRRGFSFETIRRVMEELNRHRSLTQHKFCPVFPVGDVRYLT